MSFDDEMKKAELDVLLKSKAFIDPTHSKHDFAVKEFQWLHGLTDHQPPEYTPEAQALDELVQSDAFKNNMHIDHAEAMKRFHAMHGIK